MNTEPVSTRVTSPAAAADSSQLVVVVVDWLEHRRMPERRRDLPGICHGLAIRFRRSNPFRLWALIQGEGWGDEFRFRMEFTGPTVPPYWLPSSSAGNCSNHAALR